MAQLHQVVISAPPTRRVRAAAVAAVAAVGLLAAVSATPSALARGAQSDFRLTLAPHTMSAGGSPGHRRSRQAEHGK